VTLAVTVTIAIGRIIPVSRHAAHIHIAYLALAAATLQTAAEKLRIAEFLRKTGYSRQLLITPPVTFCMIGKIMPTVIVRVHVLSIRFQAAPKAGRWNHEKNEKTMHSEHLEHGRAGNWRPPSPCP